jgi:hypothetical protein
MLKSTSTPLEILHEQKTCLQKKSDALADAIENNFNYLQRNSVALLSDAIAVSTLSSMPPFLRNLAANFLEKKQECNPKSSASRSLIIGIASGLAEVIPLFLKGKKGIIISILVKVFLKISNSKFSKQRSKNMQT